MQYDLSIEPESSACLLVFCELPGVYASSHCSFLRVPQNASAMSSNFQPMEKASVENAWRPWSRCKACRTVASAPHAPCGTFQHAPASDVHAPTGNPTSAALYHQQSHLTAYHAQLPEWRRGACRRELRGSPGLSHALRLARPCAGHQFVHGCCSCALPKASRGIQLRRPETRRQRPGPHGLCDVPPKLTLPANPCRCAALSTETTRRQCRTHHPDDQALLFGGSCSKESLDSKPERRQ
mmetsp:Transcript_90864/g.143545  ORF Transcript_90864/g.143545 Transcript_90864/m.143545 type:complete len:239 (+) Transcript_90864:824-1540(+)